MRVFLDVLLTLSSHQSLSHVFQRLQVMTYHFCPILVYDDLTNIRYCLYHCDVTGNEARGTSETPASMQDAAEHHLSTTNNHPRL